jgi:hypothetical protein
MFLPEVKTKANHFIPSNFPFDGKEGLTKINQLQLLNNR